MKSLLLLPMNLILLPAFVVALWLLRCVRQGSSVAVVGSMPPRARDRSKRG